MPLFGKSSKSPVELVRVLKESLLVLEKGGDGRKQVKFVLVKFAEVSQCEDSVFVAFYQLLQQTKTNSSSDTLSTNELVD